MHIYIYHVLFIYITKNNLEPYKMKLMDEYKWMKEIILKLKKYKNFKAVLYTHFHFIDFTYF